MSKFRKKFITLLAVLLCAMLALAAVLIYIPKSITANATYKSDNYLTISEIWQGGNSKQFNGNNMQALYAALTGKFDADFKDIESLVNDDIDKNNDKSVNSDYFRKVNDDDPSDKIEGKNVEVTFNGIKWAAVQLNVTRDTYSDGTENKTNKGDIILTLWQSDVLKDRDNAVVKSKYSSFANSTAGDYPGSMYSTSLIRVHTLNAGGYSATDNMTLPTSKHTPQAENAYARFTMSGVTDSCVDFLVKPKDVEYQEFESHALNAFLFSGYLPNDAYGLDPKKYYDYAFVAEYGTFHDGSDFGFYNATEYSFLSKGDPDRPESMYSDWQNDYLWLPSLTEIGQSDNAPAAWRTYMIYYNGIWRTNASLRSHDDTSQYAWLRDIYSAYANDPLMVSSSGNHNRTNSDYEGGVRPALHLNLTKANANAGPYIPPAPKQPQEKELTKTFTYDGIEKTFDLMDYASKFTFSNPSGGAFDAGTYALKAKNAGEYTVDALPLGGEWSDGSKDPVTFTLKINPKQIELEIQLSGTSHEVNVPPESIKASIKAPPDGVFADSDNWQTLCQGAKFSVTADGGGSFTLDDLLNKPAGIYTVSAELLLDNYKVTIKPVTYEITAHVTHIYNGEAVHIAGTTSHNVYCSYAYCTSYETKSCNISSQTAVPATCTADGYTEYECSGCGIYKIVGEGALGHDFKDQPWNKGDETNHWHVCVRGDITGDIQPHQWQRGEEFWGGEGGTRTDTCTVCGKSVTVTLEAGAVYVPSNAATYIYNGVPQEIQLSDFNPSTMQLEYYAQNKTNRLDGAPTNAGTYYVKVTLTDSSIKFEGIAERFVWIEFEIQKKPITLEIELSGTGHEIGNAPESITARIKSPNDGVFVGGDNFEELCRGVQFTVYEGGSVADLVNATVGVYTINATLVLDNYEVTITSTTYKIVAHEHNFEGQPWNKGDETNHWHDCVQCDAVGDVQPHNWNDGIITREPTEDMAGEKTFTCETCGATRTESVPYVPDEDDPNDNPDPKPGEDLDQKKQEAKDALDDIAKKKKEEIDNNPNLTDEEKQQAKDKVDEELQKGKDAIDGATSASGVDQAANEAKRNIENIGFKSGGSSFPWWIIAVAAGVLALVAVLIIVIAKKRQTADGDDNYDDFYDDEYDFDEEYEEDNLGDEDF